MADPIVRGMRQVRIPRGCGRFGYHVYRILVFRYTNEDDNIDGTSKGAA